MLKDNNSRDFELRVGVLDVEGNHAIKKKNRQKRWIFIYFLNLYLPFEKCAPWGKLSSLLCSASHEYIALASL